MNAFRAVNGFAWDDPRVAQAPQPVQAEATAIRQVVDGYEKDVGKFDPAKPPPGPRTEEMMPDFFSLKKICSRNSGEIPSSAAIVLMEIGLLA